MTLMLPRTVASQLAVQLRCGIQGGAWRRWLPTEREISLQLQASRDTVRAALLQLRHEGAIKTRHGIGHEIVNQKLDAARPSPLQTVAVLAPEPMPRLRPNISLWIDDLKDLLRVGGFELKYYHGHRYYHPQAAKALQALTRRELHAAWIIVRSSEQLQRWFMVNQVPCVVAGSGALDVKLPTVDIDYLATAFHAAGVLLRAGHRTLALINPRSRTGGDLASEAGLEKAVKDCGRSDVTAAIEYHDESPATVRVAVHRLLRRRPPPTGIIVSNSYRFLTVMTTLAQHGLRVPEDVSLISRDDDEFLNHVEPAPTRYLNNPQIFAKRILAQTIQVIERGETRVRDIRILPKFEPGCTVGPPPHRAS